MPDFIVTVTRKLRVIQRRTITIEAENAEVAEELIVEAPDGDPFETISTEIDDAEYAVTQLWED